MRFASSCISERKARNCDQPPRPGSWLASHFKLDRRRHAIGLGLTLWTVLEPAERVALLGHELGHRTNGNLRSKVVFSAALFSLRRWQLVLLPSRSPWRTGRRARSSMDSIAMLIEPPP